MTKTVLFWDIDGTLLRTGRAGVLAWEGAAREVGGQDVDFSELHTAGLTDFQIGVQILEHMHVDRDDDTLARLVRCYEELLPVVLPKRQGRVLDNVREILEFLPVSCPDVVSYLLTGNTRDGAQAKLTHYDLQTYFTEGAFARDASERSTIAEAVLEMARRTHGVGKDDVLVIGDTPRDIQCADAIGARTLAVATGDYTVSELAGHSPWKVIERLPDPEGFLELIRATEATVTDVSDMSDMSKPRDYSSLPK